MDTVWVLVNYDDHDQPVYGVYATHAVATTDMRDNFPDTDYPNLRMEEWKIL